MVVCAYFRLKLNYILWILKLEVYLPVANKPTHYLLKAMYYYEPQVFMACFAEGIKYTEK
jgi:hypothetical protein